MKQLDVLFIEPNSAKEAYQELSHNFSAIETPTWCLLLAQSVRSQGYEPAILDCVAEKLTIEQSVLRIREANPRLVVFVMYGQNPNSGTTNMIGANKLAAKLKESYPEYPICFVGTHVTNQLSKVKGIGYKEDFGSWSDDIPKLIINPPERIVPQERINVDLPGYAWDLLPYDKTPFDLYRSHFWHGGFVDENRTPFAAIYTSLGCPFSCQFCVINILNKESNQDNITAADSPGIRYWSTQFILKEFEKLASFGVKTVRISDEMFFLNKNHFEPLLNGIIEIKADFNMWAYARINTVQEKYLDLFKKSGVNWLALGIEAANQNVRLGVSKGNFKDLKIRDVVKSIRKHDLNIIANYIFGFPDDSKETCQQTLDLALELNTEMVNMYNCQALPGSAIYLDAKRKGILPKTLQGYAFLSYESEPLPTNSMTSAEVLKFRDDAWYKYFSNLNYLNLVTSKFGDKARKNVETLSMIKLKRKLLGDL
ncbi:MAG: B12-binding domain-containing radical SAM protein [Candidatus Magasanikbacteria bacterium]|nr:B12-binding domain-containing radical SAM protein [Candidatus Magasanikbacteria bacterium]